MRDENKILCLYFSYMSTFQISSRKSQETYLKQLNDKYEDILERDKTDELTEEQWNEIVEYMKSQGHTGTLEAWKQLWEKNADVLELNKKNINKIIEEELEGGSEGELENEVSDSALFKTIDESEELEEELKRIDIMDIDSLLKEYLKQPIPQASSRKRKHLERSFDQMLEEIESENPTPPQTSRT